MYYKSNNDNTTNNNGNRQLRREKSGKLIDNSGPNSTINQFIQIKISLAIIFFYNSGVYILAYTYLYGTSIFNITCKRGSLVDL